jgi:hypothetical protein
MKPMALGRNTADAKDSTFSKHNKIHFHHVAHLRDRSHSLERDSLSTILQFDKQTERFLIQPDKRNFHSIVQPDGKPRD